MQKGEIERIIGRVGLSPDQRQVVEMAFGLGGRRAMTVAEIAQELGVTNQCAGSVFSRAIGRLREALSAAPGADDVADDDLPFLAPGDRIGYVPMDPGPGLDEIPYGSHVEMLPESRGRTPPPGAFLDRS